MVFLKTGQVSSEQGSFGVEEQQDSVITEENEPEMESTGSMDVKKAHPGTYKPAESSNKDSLNDRIESKIS